MKRPHAKMANISWTIYRIRGTPAEFLGTVAAPDAEAAIAKAILEKRLTLCAHQPRELRAGRGALRCWW